MNQQRALGELSFPKLSNYTPTYRSWLSASVLMALGATSYGLSINVPPVAVTTVDQVKTFSQNNHDAVSLEDTVWSASDTVTVSISSGTLSLSGVSGLNFSAGDGTSDGTMSFSGSLVDVNTALEGLAYTPSSGMAGSSTLSLSVSGSQSASSILKIAVNATMDAEAARDDILAGVTTLANPSYPGYMVVYGDNAYSLTNYPGEDIDVSIVAAATWGAGKVLAMPDHDWLKMGTHGGDPSTGQFYKNGLAWLGDSTSLGMKVVTYDNQSSADWLIAQGFTNVVNASAASLAADLVGADVFVAGWLGEDLDQTISDDIRNYVTGGGGLFISEYGAGYWQWWGKAQDEAPGNILLREAGIGFAKDFFWSTGTPVDINRATWQMNGDQIAALIQTPANYTETKRTTAAALLNLINDALKDTDPLKLRLDDIIEGQVSVLNPTPATPVTDALEKAFLNREGQLLKNQAVADMTAHRTALPVGASAPRVNKTVSLAETITGHKYWLIDTGLYAAPGETITVTVPAAMLGIGAQVQVGHLRTDIEDPNYYTMPYQQLFFEVDSTTFDVGSPHGGLIMFVAPSGTEWSGAQSVQLNGAVEAPYFVYGTHTNAEWVGGVRDRETPFGVLVSDTTVLVIESEQFLRTLDNPHEVMDIHRNTIWWIDDFYDYHPGRPLRTHHDYQAVGGYSSMPLSYEIDYNITDYNSLVVNGEPLTMHEHGHHASHDNLVFHEFSEACPNLGGRYAQHMYMPFSWKQQLPATRINLHQNSLTDNLWNHYSHYAVDKKITIYDSIGLIFGWDKIRTIVHNISNDGSISTNQDKLDALLVQMSQTVGYDVSPYLEDWQLSFSATALSTVSSLSKWNMVHIVGDDLVLQQNTTARLINPTLNDYSFDGTLNFDSIATPSHGTLTSNGDGSYLYTPTPGYTGKDSLQYTVSNATGNTFTGTINITVNPTANHPTFESDDTHASTSGWTTVTLNKSFTSMVVVAQPVVSSGAPPVVTRIRNAGGPSGNSFEVMLQRVDGQTGDIDNVLVRYLVAEEGVYDEATHGVKMEAVKFTSTVTDTAAGTFAGEERTMAHNMFNHYFVANIFGQVMSYNDSSWSTFWSKQVNDKLLVGKHVGEDTNTTRANETIGYIIMDSGTLQIGDYRLQVGLLRKDGHANFDSLSHNLISHHFENFPRISSAFVAGDLAVPWGTTDPGDEGFWTVQEKTGNLNTVAARIIEDQLADSEQDAGTRLGSYLLVGNSENRPVTYDDTAVALEGFNTLIDLLANDLSESNVSLTITGLTQPANGTVVDNGDGTVTYTANTSYTGPDHFTYTTSNGNESDTAVVTVDVKASVMSQAGILREKWSGVSGLHISDLTSHANYPNIPTSTSILSSFEAPTKDGDNYGQRLSGYLVPPTTGDYTFWIASDQDGDLYLSTDHTPENAQRIALVDGWVWAKQWDFQSGQTSTTISLEAGKAYYIEALHKESDGSDHLAAAWQGPGIAQQVIDSQYLQTIGNMGPIIANPISDVQVNEGAADTVIDLSQVFTDPDLGDQLTFELAGNSHPSLVTASFIGNQLTLSYATAQSGVAQISVRAFDRLNTVVTDTFQVEVLHVNLPPVLGDAVFGVYEGVPISTAIGSVVASDPNADIVAYSITAGNTGGAFTIDNSGNITTATTLDAQTTSSYSLTVTVTDNTSLTDTATVTINVLNAVGGVGSTQTFTNSTPVTISSSGTPTITSNQTMSGMGGTISDVNVKLNITHTYDSDLDITLISPDGTRILLIDSRGGSTNNFTDTILDDEAIQAIEDGSAPFTGAYTPDTALSGLNGENPNGTWTLEIKDNYNDDGGSLDNWSLTITTINTNAAPTANDATFSVAENNTIGAVVGNVVATDPDAGNTIYYAITGGNTGGAFAIDTSGNITTAALLDYEAISNYILTVTVMDGGALSDTATITVNVTDVITSDDSDANTLNDNWEVTHFGNTGSIAATADTDGDGFTTFQEMVFGADPTVNSSSVRPVQSQIIDDGGTPKLEFKFRRPKNHASLNVIYQIQSGTDMVAGNWTNYTQVTPNVADDGSNPNNEWLTYKLPMPVGNRVFYRCRVINSP